jgi:hypothetical protein
MPLHNKISRGNQFVHFDEMQFTTDSRTIEKIHISVTNQMLKFSYSYNNSLKFTYY